MPLLNHSLEKTFLRKENDMAFVAVDKDGAEAIYDECPVRHAVSWLPTKYRNGEYTEWIYLPKSSIAKLIGRELTWEDEPFELK